MGRNHNKLLAGIIGVAGRGLAGLSISICVLGNYPHLVVAGTGLAFGFLLGRMILAHLCDEPEGLKTNIYMNTLGNKKLELFDTGGVSEPTAEEIVQMASDIYHIGVSSQRTCVINQRLGQRAHRKWKGPDKISRIYGDWIDDIEKKMSF
ncbi:hypothetical protein ACFE04_028005 [Oxalis oulophora]